MAGPLTSTFRAADGRPFEVVWLNEATANEPWHWNNSHYPLPLSPMAMEVWLDHASRLKAYEEAGVYPPPLFRSVELHHGFQFMRQSPYRGEEQQQYIASSRALAARFGGATKVWEQFSLPRVREVCSWLRSAPPETPCAELFAAYNRAFHLTHAAGPAVFIPLQARLAALLAPYFPEAAIPLLCQEVLQGADNETVDSDRAIARLAAIANADEKLRQTLLDGQTAIALPKNEAFEAGLRDYLDRYGFRAQSWAIDTPTLNEQPELLLDLVRSAMKAEQSPDERRRAAARTRERALAEIRERVGASVEAAEVEAVVGELDGYVAVREGRALWQLTSGGCLRTALLRKGAPMVEAGAIDRAEDILFLVPAEVDPFFATGTVIQDLRGAVQQRRAERDSWMTTTPPPVISTNAEHLVAAPATGAIALLHGIAGSRGSATAPARVIMDLDEADTMEAGDVLVCVTTSPPWTPLFGLAAAVVTDSGFALSHSAIAAREYGIPAVVGTHDATRRIRTGDLLTVDGGAGTVAIERR